LLPTSVSESSRLISSMRPIAHQDAKID
jgi:hypothetical protein